MKRPCSQRLTQLLRLQGLRVSAAESEYCARQTERDAVLEAMQERQARIERLRRQRAALAVYVAGQAAAEFARLAGFANARRAWLDDALERDEYWLLDDERELREAEAKTAQARQQWLHARSREAGAQNLLDDARSLQAREDEQRQETENCEHFSAAGRTR